MEKTWEVGKADGGVRGYGDRIGEVADVDLHCGLGFYRLHLMVPRIWEEGSIR